MSAEKKKNKVKAGCRKRSWQPADYANSHYALSPWLVRQTQRAPEWIVNLWMMNRTRTQTFRMLNDAIVQAEPLLYDAATVIALYLDDFPLDAVPPAIVSVHSSQQVPVTFVNLTDQKVDMHWMDGQGRERWYSTLSPMQEFMIHTFLSHPWVARLSSNEIYEATAEAPFPQVARNTCRRMLIRSQYVFFPERRNLRRLKITDPYPPPAEEQKKCDCETKRGDDHV